MQSCLGLCCRPAETASGAGGRGGGMPLAVFAFLEGEGKTGRALARKLKTALKWSPQLISSHSCLRCAFVREISCKKQLSQGTSFLPPGSGVASPSPLWHRRSSLPSPALCLITHRRHQQSPLPRSGRVIGGMHAGGVQRRSHGRLHR